MKNLLSLEIVVLSIGFAVSGFVAWNDVTTDVQANTTTIEQQEKHGDERYKDLKEGQRHIQELLEQLLIKERDTDEGNGGS